MLRPELRFVIRAEEVIILVQTGTFRCTFVTFAEAVFSRNLSLFQCTTPQQHLAAGEHLITAERTRALPIYLPAGAVMDDAEG